MKILLVSGISYPEIGGPSSYVNFLTQHLQEVDVLSFNFFDKNKTQIKMINGKKYYLLRRNYLPSTILSFPIRVIIMAYFVRRLSKNRIIYAQDVGISGFASLLSFKRYYLRFVGDWAYESYFAKRIFSISYEEFFKTKKRLVMRIISRMIFLRAKKIFTPAKHLKRLLEKYYYITSTKIKVLPNFPDINSIKRERSIVKYHLWVGRIIALKRLDRLLKASILVSNKEKIIVVGDGFLKQIMEKYSPTNISYTGRKTKNELLKMFKNAKSLILTSEYEGIPFIVLEAAYNHLPIIAYGNEGIVEISEFVKGMYIYRDEKELAKYMIKKELKETYISSLPHKKHHIDTLLKEIQS